MLNFIKETLFSEVVAPHHISLFCYECPNYLIFLEAHSRSVFLILDTLLCAVIACCSFYMDFSNV